MSEYLENKLAQLETMLIVFKDSLVTNPTITQRTAAIKNFELTYELSWKVMKLLLQFREGENLPSTSAVIKKAFSYGLIPDEKEWLDMIQLRNKAVHVYGESLAVSVYEQLHKVINNFDTCLHTMKTDLGLI